MFCPRCSQPQPAEDLRFCPGCGLPFGAVRELLGRHEPSAAGGEHARGPLPPARDVATGALLMFAGSVVAVLWGFTGRQDPAEVALPQAYFILGGTLAFLLTAFHPLLRSLEQLFDGGGHAPYTQRRRDGVNLGALLMFVGALKALLLTSAMPRGPQSGLTAIAFMAGMLLLVMLLRPILRAARGLFFKDAAAGNAAPAEAAETLGAARAVEEAAALPPARAVPVGEFADARADTGRVVAPPPSVTEETTRKLYNS